MGLREAVKHSFKREAKIVEDDTCTKNVDYLT